MSFGRQKTLLASAAALVAAEFALFGKFLTNLAPPLPDIDVKVGVASFLSLLALLAISAAANHWKKKTTAKLLAVIAAVCAIAGVGSYFRYESLQSEYVFYFPNEHTGKEERQIRGEYHADGKKRADTKTTAAAVKDDGGIEWVRDQQILWTADAQHQIEIWLLTLYTTLSTAFGAALFALLALLTDKREP